MEAAFNADVKDAGTPTKTAGCSTGKYLNGYSHGRRPCRAADVHHREQAQGHRMDLTNGCLRR